MGTSPLGKDSIWEGDLAARAAWLSHIAEKTQSEIAEILGVSSARVHRLLILAKEQGIVRITIDGRPSECLQLEADICARFGLRSCTVSPYMRDAKLSPDAARASVGQAAAQLISQHVLNCPKDTVMAVGLGQTLMAAMQAIPSIPRPDIALFASNGMLNETLGTLSETPLTKLAERLSAVAHPLPTPRLLLSDEERAAYLSIGAIGKVVENAGAATYLLGEIGTLGAGGSLAQEGWISSELAEQLDEIATVELFGMVLDADGTPIGTTQGLGADESHLKSKLQAGALRSFVLASGNVDTGSLNAALSSALVTDLILDEGTARVLAN